MTPLVDRRFDVVWFGGGLTLSEPLFRALLAQSELGHGHYIVMPTTNRVKDVEEAGNRLAHYDTSLSRAQAARKGIEAEWRRLSAEHLADTIAEAHRRGGPDKIKRAPFPTPWIFLNELSRKLWLTESAYRKWVIALTQRLAEGDHKVVIFSPMTKAGGSAGAALADDWRRLADHAVIAIEGYLSGPEVKSNSDDAVRFCAMKYGEMKQAYVDLGVPTNRLFLTEHFGQTTGAGKGPRGRWGLQPDKEWRRTIEVRCGGAGDVRFAGYVTYAWMYNQMNRPSGQLVRFSKTYGNAAARHRLGLIGATE
jgi:hypothetical protein